MNCFGPNEVRCRNNWITLKKSKRAKIGRSNIAAAGLGLFAAEFIRKDDFVMTYAGEIIGMSIDHLRESLSKDLNFYNFNSPEGTIDARFMGNISRFINHGNNGKENLESQNIFCQGNFVIAFYANRNIEVGEELFFNYDGQGLLY